MLFPIIITILAGIYPVLFAYAHNVSEISLSTPFYALLLYACIGFVTYLCLYVFFRDTKKTTIVGVVLLFTSLLFGSFYLLYDSLSLSIMLPLSPNKVMLLLFILINSATFLFCMKSSLREKVYESVLFFVLFLTIINFAKIIPYEIARIMFRQKIHNYTKKHFISEKKISSSQKVKPDIYYIIFDRYARADVLQKYFDFDNTPFISYLKENNFIVSSNAYANYPTTNLSLSSSLNMEHVTFLSALLGEKNTDTYILNKELIEPNSVIRMLKEIGYTTYLFGTSWNGTSTSRYADFTVNATAPNDEFNNNLFQNTVVNYMQGMLFKKQFYPGVWGMEKKNENVTLKMKTLLTMPQKQGPKFIFAHFLVSHPPRILDKNCKMIDLTVLRKIPEEKRFIQEIQCANSLMKQIVSALQKSKKPYVIVFQSDEGPYLPQNLFAENRFSENPTKDAITIHDSILNAIYFSDYDTSEMNIKKIEKEFQTPVNTFRLIFNYYFDTKLPLLQNSAFINPLKKSPYKLIKMR